jgi:hypothetical protein
MIAQILQWLYLKSDYRDHAVGHLHEADLTFTLHWFLSEETPHRTIISVSVAEQHDRPAHVRAH